MCIVDVLLLLTFLANSVAIVCDKLDFFHCEKTLSNLIRNNDIAQPYYEHSEYINEKLMLHILAS